LINELTQGSADVPALLLETHDPETNSRFYCVNHRGWQAFMDAHEEGKFLLECYRQVGHLLDSDFANMVFELPDLDRKEVNNLSRKFLHLVKVKAHKTSRSKSVLDAIIEALIGNKQLEITYDGGLRTVRPLTLCQHRDELYLMGYRSKDHGEWEKRTYKLTRISGIKVLDRGFPYPGKKEWDPVKEYESSSGLVLGPVKKVQVRVFGDSRKIIAEKDFFNGEFINREKDFDSYLCTYTNHHEFLGQLFVYAQDVEIVDDEELREQFVLKAQAGLLRNSMSKVNVKKGSG
jgi:predicted DNA-binding transcriptional regulator YafY